MPAEIGDQTALRRGVVYLVTYVNRAKSLELHSDADGINYNSSR